MHHRANNTAVVYAHPIDREGVGVGYKAAPIVLDDKTRAELVRRVRAATTSQRDARRARIILLAADGVSSAQIAKQVAISPEYVALWRKRFLARGLAGLVDEPRPGRPEIYGHDDRIRMAALATAARDPDDPEPLWTYQALADALADDVGVSRSQVWRILRDMDIKPHLVRG